MKEQLADMTIIELVRTAHSYAASIQPIETYSAIVTEMGSRLEALNLAHIAAMNNLRSATSAKPIPDGYALVPKEMCLSAEAMEAICFHCGDGGFAFGEFTDGVLFVGDSEPEEGKKVHGLHIVTADYPEEGCALICEFLPVPGIGEAV